MAQKQEWKLVDFPKEYRELKSLIQSSEVVKIEEYFKSLIEGDKYSFGTYSFSPFGLSPPSALPPSDPRKTYTQTGLCELSSLKPTMQSLVMIACHHPYQTPAVIKYLFCNFHKHISIDQLEWCYHSLHSWSCVAPLHVACTGYNQNLKLVRVLVKLGADVNLKSGCCEVTPLHLAVASYGEEPTLDIARFLIDHGATVDAVDRNGDTPLTLMFRCYGGSQIQEIMEVLISKKANVNHLNNLGCTALHYAAHNNDVHAVTSLLSFGASPLFELSENPSSPLPCPLYLATFEEVANVFTSRSDCPVTCKIDSLLLIGATNTLSVADSSMSEMWIKAVALREEHRLMPSGGNSINGIKEIQSMSDLERCLENSVRFGNEDVATQSLLIKERCIRYYCNLYDLVEIHSTIREYGNDVTVLIIIKCLKLVAHCIRNTILPHWSLGIEKYWRSQLSTLYSILNTLKVGMSQKYGDGELTFAQVQEYAEHCIGIVEALSCSYSSALCTKAISMHFETKNVIWSLLSVLVTWLSWLGIRNLNSNDYSLLPLKHVIQKLVDKNLYLMDTTLLHFIPENFPCDCIEDDVDLYELILQSDGAESAVNFVSSQGDRPLHSVAKNASEPQHLSLISSLCDNGAHYDAVNMKGNTALDYLIKSDLFSHLEHYIPPSPLPLACLASQTIVTENVPYQIDCVPPGIKKYISIHDPKCCVFLKVN